VLDVIVVSIVATIKRQNRGERSPLNLDPSIGLLSRSARASAEKKPAPKLIPDVNSDREGEHDGARREGREGERKRALSPGIWMR